MRPGNLLRPIAALLIAAAVNPAGAAVRDSANHDQTEGLTLFDTAAGERIDVEQDRQSAPPVNAPEELVKRIQKGLADQGFYLGPITGRMDRKTEDAIRAYQASAELPVDGRPTAQLAMDLETGGKVGQLLNRLEEVRGASVKAARDALLAHPETRHLLNESAQPDAQPRDNAACMAEPEPRCLLLEAAASARDIDKPELRDWALGEILVSQAKAGLAKDALATTRRIHDPRLVMVALRDIAKAQAVGNRNDEAQAAAAIIPDAQLRAEAYAAIAEVQASRGKAELAVATAELARPLLDALPKMLPRVELHTRLATALHQTGRPHLAAAHMSKARRLVDAITVHKEKDAAQRHIATAYAAQGDSAKALDVLKNVQNGSDDVPILIAAATGQARSGAIDQALITAEGIEAVRYRALVLARIATLQAEAGNLAQARESLDKAREAAGNIRFPFAKAYAFSRVALAANEMSIGPTPDNALLKRAIDYAHLISDPRLKAQVLWTMADARARGGDAQGAADIQDAANSATRDILSPFSRVWMLCDIAEERAGQAETAGSWQVFKQAMDEAKTIKNPWGRSRALARVASTMTVLADRTVQTRN
ncbi:MAG: peptidoglycan-binding protein [Alphaproteobacteria bacterium]|nr:peptidoglycan-binding protein [Alphaproteobacteria bacterium]